MMYTVTAIERTIGQFIEYENCHKVNATLACISVYHTDMHGNECVSKLPVEKWEVMIRIK